MTGLSAASVRGWREGIQAAAAVATLAVIVGGLLTWFAGGSLIPQQQVQVQQLTTKVGELSNQVGELSNQVSVLSQKINDMPRPVDYTAINQHLSNLDQQVGDIKEQQRRDENDFSYVKGTMQRLGIGTETSVRDPRHP